MSNKTVKLKFVGFWPNFKPEMSFTYNCLINNGYNVQVVEDADYIVCSIFGEKYEYCKYPQVRIMEVEENYIPDFNLVDYGICHYPITLQDRCFSFPVCVEYVDGTLKKLTEKNRDYSSDILKQKTLFANFIASHESEYNIRGDFFKKLNEYKRVESAGSYLNNMPNGALVNREDGSKTELQQTCKFTLCFESTKHEGFVTEKIAEAFLTDSIPIYYGSSMAKEIFNKNAYIDIADYNSFDDAVKKIIELDNNDEEYLKMLSQPIFKDSNYYQNKMEQLEKFICHIFEQPIEKAYRRSRVYWPQKYNDYFVNCNLQNKTVAPKKACVIKRIIKKLLKK